MIWILGGLVLVVLVVAWIIYSAIYLDLGLGE